MREAVSNFALLGKDAQKRFLTEILNLCGSRQLGFVQQHVSPMLKRDPFKVLPNELCLRVRSSASIIWTTSCYGLSNDLFEADG